MQIYCSMSSLHHEERAMGPDATVNEDMWTKMGMSPNVANFMRQNSSALFTIIGVLIGLIIGIILNSENSDNIDDLDGWTKRQVMYVKFLGKLFLSMLKGIIIPLVVPSIIASVGSLNLSVSGRVGYRAAGYYLTTTLLAVILGVILVTSVSISQWMHTFTVFLGN